MSTLQPLSFDVFSGDEAALVEKIITDRSDPSYFTPSSPITAGAGNASCPNQDLRFRWLAPNSVWSNTRNIEAHHKRHAKQSIETASITCKAARLSE